MATVPSNLIPTRLTQLPTAPVGATAATSQMVIVYNGNTYQVTASDIVSTTSLAGGIASQVPYQSASGVTAFVTNGTAGQVLISNGTSAPAWVNIDGGTF